MFPNRPPPPHSISSVNIGITEVSEEIIEHQQPQRTKSGRFSRGASILKPAHDFLRRIASGSRPKSQANIVVSEFHGFLSEFDKRVKNYRELFLYIVFIVLFLVILFLQRDVLDTYAMEQGLKSALVSQTYASPDGFPMTYLDISSFDEYGAFLLNVLAPTLTTNVNGSGPGGTFMAGQRPTIMGNIVLGAVRIRQARVRDNICQIDPVIAGIVPVCYPNEYSTLYRDTHPFGPPSDPNMYTWTSGSRLGTSSRWSILSASIVFDGSGYVMDYPLGTDFVSEFQSLIDTNFWSEGTRLLVITINFLNPNINWRLGSFELVFEVTSGGLTVPYYSFYSCRLFMYHEAMDWIRLVLEIVFLGILCYFLASEVSEMLGAGLKEYFRPFSWNYIELINLLLFVTTFALYIIFAIRRPSEEFDLASSNFVNLPSLVSIPNLMYQTASANVVISFVKTFKFLSLNKSMNILWDILADATADLMRFGIIFLIFFLSFALMGMITFGGMMTEFKSLGSAIGTCFSFLIGDAPSFEGLTEINRILGPIFYIFFVAFIIIILSNMFIAILSGKYDKFSKTSKASNSNEHQGSFWAEIRSESLYVREVFRRDQHHNLSKCATPTLCKLLDDEWTTEGWDSTDLLKSSEQNQSSSARLCARRLTELKRLHDIYLTLRKIQTEAKIQEQKRKKICDDHHDDDESHESDSDQDSNEISPGNHVLMTLMKQTANSSSSEVLIPKKENSFPRKSPGENGTRPSLMVLQAPASAVMRNRAATGENEISESNYHRMDE